MWSKRNETRNRPSQKKRKGKERQEKEEKEEKKATITITLLRENEYPQSTVLRTIENEDHKIERKTKNTEKMQDV